MEKRENQRIVLTKRLIKEGLTELLVTESIHKISIRALCETAGINRSTFYKYYGSQYDVLAEMEEDLLSNIRTALEGGAADETSTRKLLEVICGYLEKNVAAIRVMVGNNVDPEFPEKLFHLPQIQQILMSRLGTRYDQESCRYIYLFVVNGSYHLLKEWVRTDDRRSFTEIAFLIQELIDRVCG